MKIKIKGVIISNSEKWIYDWFGMDSTSPKDISTSLEKANGEDLEVEINSGGGSVSAGSEIYTLLKEYKGNITTKIMGIAASAASVIAMAGKKVLISPTAQIMIHNVSSSARGDHRDMEHEAAVLKNYNKSIANAYMLKTNKSQEELLKLMNKETWLNAQQALENNFVDEVMFDKENKLVASYTESIMLPEEVINKMRNYLNTNPNKVSKPVNQESNIKKSKIKTKLNLLKIKGVNDYD